MEFIFPSDDGQLFKASENTFLLFIDETGNESFKDPNFPIFGFGGVGLPASLYLPNICHPWNYIKNKAFGGENVPMHAANLNKPTHEQLTLLNEFFSNCTFCRIAAVISDKTVFEGDFDIYNLAVSVFYQRILEVLAHTAYNDMFMIFESSQRGNPLNANYFSRYKIQRSDDTGALVDVDCQKFIMSKSEMEPGLEVADFVAQTAGASVRARLSGKVDKNNMRKDFNVIFHSGDKKLSSFCEITRVEQNTK